MRSAPQKQPSPKTARSRPSGKGGCSGVPSTSWRAGTGIGGSRPGRASGGAVMRGFGGGGRGGWSVVGVGGRERGGDPGPPGGPHVWGWGGAAPARGPGGPGPSFL